MNLLKRLGWTLTALVAAGIGIGIYVLFNPYWIKVESVQLTLAPSSTQDVIYQRIRTSLAPQLQTYAGRFFWDVPLSKVYEIASKDKRVRKVQVYREFPTKLRVEIEPQTPVLAYLSGDNRIYPVAADATLLPALGLTEMTDMPIIRGEELKDELKLREAALDLFEQIPNEGALKKKSVSEILYSRKDGFRIFINGSASEVRIGDADFGPKLLRVEKVLAYLDSQNIKGRVIDARFSKKVVVRVRKGP
jgi:cell division septal protein FtsQ